MKVINFKNDALTETECNTLKTFFSLIDEEGLKFIGLALIADHTVVLVDLNKAKTTKEVKEQVIHYMDLNLQGMPDFSAQADPNQKIAWCSMYESMIMTQVPYQKEFDNADSLLPFPFLDGRQEALDACEKKEIRAIAWWDEARELKDE